MKQNPHAYDVTTQPDHQLNIINFTPNDNANPLDV